jgi:hypothetical protein
MNIKRLSRPNRWGALVLLSFVAFNAMADCREILEQGLRNTYSLVRSGDFKTSFSNSFCNSNLQKSSSSAGGNGDVGFETPYGPIGFGGGYDESQAKEFRNSACGGAHGSLSDAQYLNVLQKIADPNIVSAWSECQASSGGLLLNGELLDSTNLKVSLVFRNVGPVTQAVLTDEPRVIGAVCENIPWKKGTLINGNRQFVMCTRKGNSAVFFIVNSDYSGATFYIPQPQTITLAKNPRPDPFPPPPPPPEPIDGFTVDALICAPNGAGPGPEYPNSMPRCPASCKAVGSPCSCAGFTGSVVKIKVKGVIAVSEGTACP